MEISIMRAHFRLLLPFAFLIQVFPLSLMPAQPADDEEPAMNGISFMPAANPAADSLELQLLANAIRHARERVAATNFWHRLLPRIQVSCSVGLHDLVFQDPATSGSYILPADAYRLSVGISLNELADASSHDAAVAGLEALELRRARFIAAREIIRKQQARRLAAAIRELMLKKEELTLLGTLLEFHQMRFNQGKIDYAALVATRLRVIGTTQAVDRLQLQINELFAETGRSAAGDPRP
jgi:hypothetical protein